MESIKTINEQNFYTNLSTSNVSLPEKITRQARELTAEQKQVCRNCFTFIMCVGVLDHDFSLSLADTIVEVLVSIFGSKNETQEKKIVEERKFFENVLFGQGKCKYDSIQNKILISNAAYRYFDKTYKNTMTTEVDQRIDLLCLILEEGFQILDLPLIVILDELAPLWKPIHSWLTTHGYLGVLALASPAFFNGGWKTKKISEVLATEMKNESYYFYNFQQEAKPKSITKEEIKVLARCMKALHRAGELPVSTWKKLPCSPNQEAQACVEELLLMFPWITRLCQGVLADTLKYARMFRKTQKSVYQKNMEKKIVSSAIAIESLGTRVSQLEELIRQFDFGNFYPYQINNFTKEIEFCMNDTKKVFECNVDLINEIKRYNSVHRSQSDKIFEEYYERLKVGTDLLSHICLSMNECAKKVRDLESLTCQSNSAIVESLFAEKDLHEGCRKICDNYMRPIVSHVKMTAQSGSVAVDEDKPSDEIHPSSKRAVVHKRRKTRISKPIKSNCPASLYRDDDVSGLFSRKLSDTRNAIIEQHQNLLNEIPDELKSHAGMCVEEIGDHLFLAAQSLEVLLASSKSGNYHEAALALQMSYLDLGVTLEQFLALHYLKEHDGPFSRHDLWHILSELSEQPLEVLQLCKRYRLALFWSRFFCQSVEINRRYQMSSARLNDLKWVWEVARGKEVVEASKFATIVSDTVADFAVMTQLLLPDTYTFSQGWVERLQLEICQNAAPSQTSYNWKDTRLQKLSEGSFGVVQALLKPSEQVCKERFLEVSHLANMMDIALNMREKLDGSLYFWNLRATLLVDKIAEPLYQTIVENYGHVKQSPSGHLLAVYQRAISCLGLLSTNEEKPLIHCNLRGWHHYSRRPASDECHQLYLHHLDESLRLAGNSNCYAFDPSFTFEDMVDKGISQLVVLFDAAKPTQSVKPIDSSTNNVSARAQQPKKKRYKKRKR